MSPESADRAESMSPIAPADRYSAAEMLPLVYDELRRLAGRHLGGLPPGQTLGPTALVHEAYLRLVGGVDRDGQPWDGRGHFYVAAAEAMRRILLDRARAKGRLRRGGGRLRRDFDLTIDSVVDESAPPDDLIDLNEALTRLAEVDEAAAGLVKLRVFAGLTMGEAARSLGIARRTADRDWAFARAWLIEALRAADDAEG